MAVRLQIVVAANGTVDNGIPVAVRALDQYNNIVTNFSGTVQLASSSATVTGAGLVNISAGVGTVTLRDTKHEIVQLSLSTSSVAGLNLSSTAPVQFLYGLFKVLKCNI